MTHEKNAKIGGIQQPRWTKSSPILTPPPLQMGTLNTTLFNDPTRDSIANNFVISFYCRCLQILYQIAFFYKI